MMKPYILALTLLLVGWNAISAQKIVAIEYSIDQFVREGEGTRIEIDENLSELDDTFSFDISKLSHGNHVVYIRALNDGGTWGLPICQSFYIQNPQSPVSITEMEYSIDDFVREGEGEAISFDGDETSINSTVAISTQDLSKGNHNLWIRSKNADGNWSIPIQSSFYVTRADETLISKIYYRFAGTDFNGNWQSISIDPHSKEVDTNLDFSIIELLNDNSYTAEIYAQNDMGVRSFSVFTNEFTKRVNHEPIAKYESLNLSLMMEEILEISLDTLFSDEDMTYGDTLSYSIENKSDVGGNFFNWDSDLKLNFNPQLGENGTYSYWVHATDSKESSDIIQLNIEVSNTVGIESYGVTKPKIVPNPNNGIFKIVNIPNGDFTISVYSMDGKLLNSFKNMSSIELYDLSEGVYLIYFKIDEMIFREKVIIKH